MLVKIHNFLLESSGFLWENPGLNLRHHFSHRFSLLLGLVHDLIQSQSNYLLVATYVDDLSIALKEPLKLLNHLQQPPHKLKLKDTQQIEGAIHLDYKFDQDKNDVLYMDLNQYINCIEDAYCNWFKDNPNTNVKSLLESSDHP